MVIKNWHKVGCSRSDIVASLAAVSGQARGRNAVVRVVLRKSVCAVQRPLEVQQMVVEMGIAEAVEFCEMMRSAVDAHKLALAE